MSKGNERRKPWITESEVADFARLHPKQAVRVRFSYERVIEEFISIGDAFDKGGYRYGSDFPLHHMEELAREALIVDVDQIAMAMKTGNYEYTYDEMGEKGTNDYALIGTFVFEDAEDADRFRSVIEVVGYDVIEDDSPPD